MKHWIRVFLAGVCAVWLGGCFEIVGDLVCVEERDSCYTGDRRCNNGSIEECVEVACGNDSVVHSWEEVDSCDGACLTRQSSGPYCE